MSPSRALVISLLPVALIGPVGCGWVDATGHQAGSASDGMSHAAPGVPVPLSDPAPLAPSAPLALLEKTSRDVSLPDAEAHLRGWSWRLVEEGSPPAACAAANGFDAALAASSLRSACSDPQACTLEVEELEEGGATRLRVRLPALRAPLAAELVLSVRDGSGRALEHRRTLCGLSINEAPLAADDRVSVRAGQALEVSATDAASLLVNDTDDDDVRNRPLAIDPVPARAPRHAELFELGRDGGFRYRPHADLRPEPGETLEDSFAYTLSDGLHEVVAEVVVVIVRDNRPPLARAPLPDIELTVGARGDEGDGKVDLARFFDDPDGDPLRFEFLPDSLPPSGNLALRSDGVLVGRASLADLGARNLTLRVSDGHDTIERQLRLLVVRAFEANRPPTVVDIADVTLDGNFTYDVAPFFDDADGDRLEFSAEGLPKGIDIDRDGLIKGKAKRRNRGSWFVVVEADDGRGGRVEAGFRLTVE